MTAAQNLNSPIVPAAIGYVARTCHAWHVMSTICCNIDAQHFERTEKSHTRREAGSETPGSVQPWERRCMRRWPVASHITRF
jgi:hypothetical protein